MDHIVLKGIRVHTVIGLHKGEQIAEQELLVSLDAVCDFAKIQESDKLADGCDYCEIIAHVRKYAAGFGGHTLEYFAHHLAVSLKADFHFKKIDIWVDKPRYVKELGLEAIQVHVER